MVNLSRLLNLNRECIYFALSPQENIFIIASEDISFFPVWTQVIISFEKLVYLEGIINIEVFFHQMALSLEKFDEDFQQVVVSLFEKPVSWSMIPNK